MRTRVVSAAVIAATVLCTAAPASAFLIRPESCSYVWSPVGTGCAREIAVGPNNVPWILGCPNGEPWASGPAGLYYLSYNRPPGELIGSPQWNFDGIYGINVFVNLNSMPIVSGADGLLYLEDHYNYDTDGILDPSGRWQSFDTGANLGQVVVSALYSNNPWVYSGEYGWPFPSPNIMNPYQVLAVWGMGCGNVCARGPYMPLSGNPNGNIFQSQVEFYDNYGDLSTFTNPWQSPPGAAISMALFTDPPPSTAPMDGASNLTHPASDPSQETYQNPWVVTDQGTIWYYRPDLNRFLQAPLFPDGYQTVRWLTDHFALDDAGNVWQWTGPSAGGASSNLWQAVEGISPVAANYNYGTNEPVIVQIAYSQAASGGFAGECTSGSCPASDDIGPSSLWGIDSSGNIYSAAYRCVVQ